MISNQIISIFENYKMAAANSAVDQFETVGKKAFTSKVEAFISSNKPIEFVMLGYPFKSTNTLTKVLGTEPDKNEEISIQRLNQFTSDIQKVYSPGAIVHIASDGYVFNDLLGVEDHVVDIYKQMCLDLSTSDSFKILDIRDFYSRNISTSREKVMSHFGITLEMLEQKIISDIDTNWLYRGMMRFMEEELMMREFPSRNQRHLAAKKLTKEMMLRNEAWSNLVKHNFANNVRLSMHQSTNNGTKFSFDLIKNAKHSPWHSVLVKDNDVFLTMHKKDAIANGYILNTNYFEKH